MAMCLIPAALSFVVPGRSGAQRALWLRPAPGAIATRERRVLALAAKNNGGKGGKVRVPYKETGGGEGASVVGGALQGRTGSSALPVVVDEDVAASLELIKKKVEEAQKMIVRDEDSLESFISSGIDEWAPEDGLTLTGRIPSDWLEVDFSICLGKGGYGDVYEATITDGPLKGSRAVAKRAYYQSKGKVRWRGKDADGNSISATATSSASSSRSGSGSGDADDSNADEYLEVEDYVNRLITANCPHIAAPYIGDCVQEGRRWLVWHYEEGGVSLSDLISQAHLKGTLRGLANALGIDNFQDGNPACMQRLISKLGMQLLVLCEHLVEQGICHRDIKPGNLLICPQTKGAKLIDFGAAAAVGLDERVGFDAERGPCDEKYHAPEQLIEEEHWDVYDVYSVGLTLVRVLFRPLWDPGQFNAFMEDFRGPESKENLDMFFSKLILRQSSLPPDRELKALKKAPRASLELFTTVARRSRGSEYIELAQALAPLPPKADADDVSSALGKADEWMDEMLKQRRLEEQFVILADIEEEGGGMRMSKEALSKAFAQAGKDKSEDEIASLFKLLDENGDNFIDIDEFKNAFAQAEQSESESMSAEEEEEEEEEAILDATGFIVGLRALEIDTASVEAVGGLASDGRVTWELLRGMLAKQPMARLTPTKALAQLKSAGKSAGKTAGKKGGAGAERGGASAGVLAAIRDEIKGLKERHKKLNVESDRLKSALSATGVSDAIVYTDLQMLKKQKLALKDQMARLERLLEQSQR